MWGNHLNRGNLRSMGCHAACSADQGGYNKQGLSLTLLKATVSEVSQRCGCEKDSPIIRKIVGMLILSYMLKCVLNGRLYIRFCCRSEHSGVHEQHDMKAGQRPCTHVADRSEGRLPGNSLRRATS